MESSFDFVFWFLPDIDLECSFFKKERGEKCLVPSTTVMRCAKPKESGRNNITGPRSDVREAGAPADGVL